MRGRKKAFLDKFEIVDALAKIQEDAPDKPSRYLTLKLVDQGLVSVTTIKHPGRGRPRVVYEVSGKGRSRIGLGKTWKRA